MHISLRAKVMTVVAVTAVAFASLVGASELVARRVQHQLYAIREHYVPRVELEPALRGQLERLERAFQDAVASHDVDALDAVGDLRQAFLAQLAAGQGALDPNAADALRLALATYCAEADDVSRRLIANETGEALGERIAAMQADQFRLTALIQTSTSVDRQALASAFTQAAAAESEAGSYRLGISIACLAVAFALAAWIGRGIIRSFAALAEGLDRFGAGDFRRHIHVKGHDELADLAEQANAMASRLEVVSKEQQQSEAKFRSLMESAPDAMVIMGQDGRIALVNAQTERLFGYSRDELAGAPVEILMAEKHRAAHGEGRASYFREPRIRSMGAALDLYGRRKDGTEFPVEITLSPIDTEEGTLVSGAIRDVTERKRIESALRFSNKELEAFSYSVAHDLRAPLRGIHGFSHALLEDSADKLDDEGKEFLRRICAGAERMAELIDALLTLSRVSRMKIQRQSVDLSALAHIVVGQLRASTPDRTVEFVAEPGIRANGDAPLLRAMLENLLGNAWKFTGARPEARITFGCKYEESAPVYYVADNGAGFDMAFANKLFAPFQRLHTVQEFAGTGIGLATVQRIVRRHGGEIWAEAALGKGATFLFTLGNAEGGVSA
ncbi:MAG TPA: PAS domain S-box protein [Polyangiaceae bacterium]|jgi:PAS domain S-box-containing protein